MQQDLHAPKEHFKQATDFDSRIGWVIGGLCTIVFMIALYFTILFAGSNFSDFASMSVFP
jgi:hypothetical protein